MITNLIEPRLGKLLSRVLQRTSGQLLFQTDFRKWLLGTLCLDSRFQNHPDSVILQKYQSLSKQSFKHNSAHMPFLNLTSNLSFEPRFHMIIINSYYMGGLPKTFLIYPTIMKLGTVIPYLTKIQKLCESCDIPLEFCWHEHFLPEIGISCYIKKYRYRFHLDI